MFSPLKKHDKVVLIDRNNEEWVGIYQGDETIRGEAVHVIQGTGFKGRGYFFQKRTVAILIEEEGEM